MKKIITILITIILIFSFSVCYAAEMNFSDVKADDWFYKNIQELVQKNIVTGYPDGNYKPSNTLKFEEFIKMLVVAIGEEPEQKEGQEWYQIYIDEALESKYISEQQKALVGQNINRGAMAGILYNVLTKKEDIAEYTDVELEYLASRLTDLNKTDLKTLTIYSIGVISGYPDRTFKPDDTLTRAEAVAVISRVINPSLRNHVSMPDTRTLDELPEVDLGHLYEIPTLLGKTVEEENKDILYPDGISFALGEPDAEIKELFKLLHNRDYRTIGNNKEQYIKDVNYYLGGVKEYKGIEYDEGLKAYHTQFNEKDSQEYRDYILSLNTYIEDFFDEWIKDTVENKVKVQADFYTDESLIIYVNGWRAVRGTLRIKYDSHLKPENIKYELDFVETESIKKIEESHIKDEIGVSRNSYNIYKDFNELPQLEVGKWYEIDLEVALSGRLVNPKLYVENGEKVIDSYEYVYVLDIKELEN